MDPQETNTGEPREPLNLSGSEIGNIPKAETPSPPKDVGKDPISDVKITEEVKKAEAEKPEPEKTRKRKSIRTYYDDIANAVKRQGVSMTKMVLAERHREEKQQQTVPEPTAGQKINKEARMKVAPIRPQYVAEEPRSRGNLIIVLISILLVMAGAGGLYYLYINKLGEESEPPRETTHNEFMLVNETFKIDVTNLSRNEILSLVKEASREEIPAGDVTNLSIITSRTDTETEEVIETPSETRDFLEALETNIDLALMRSIDEQFMLGIYSSDKDRPFLVMKTSFFENAFAGLLRWENSIESDLPFIVVDPKDETPSGVSGDEEATEENLLFEFTDLVIANRDARALIDKSSGRMRIVYSFPDKNTLIITSNAETLREIFDRLTVSRFE